jgi:hypothetical protein
MECIIADTLSFISALLLAGLRWPKSLILCLYKAVLLADARRAEAAQCCPARVPVIRCAAQHDDRRNT